MSLAGVTENVTVNAEAPRGRGQPRTSQTYTKAEMDVLPVGRRPLDIAELSPGVTTNVFNSLQATLVGSFGYDNVFMVNGVDINDNVYGTPNNLFIEDAVEETTVLTHGISAEYGRFSGGVVNIVTRSGGNTFSGSFREGLSQPGVDRPDPAREDAAISSTSTSRARRTRAPSAVRWCATSCGSSPPADYETANIPNTFAQNGAGYTRTDTNRRGELKFTGTFAPAQTRAGELHRQRDRAGQCLRPRRRALLDAEHVDDAAAAQSADGAQLQRQHYAPAVRDAQYSEKKQSFRNNGGTSTDISQLAVPDAGRMAGVPGGLVYNAPYLDATDPESRNNRQFTGSLDVLLATDGFGSHEAERRRRVLRQQGNRRQLAVVHRDRLRDGLPDGGRRVVRDAAGKPVPVFTPGVTEIWTFLAKRGAEIDIATTSFYVQDRWVATRRADAGSGHAHRNRAFERDGV